MGDGTAATGGARPCAHPLLIHAHLNGRQRSTLHLRVPMQYPAQSPFQGIWIPLVTPFADGAVDYLPCASWCATTKPPASMAWLPVAVPGRQRAGRGRTARGARRRAGGGWRAARGHGPGRQSPGSCPAAPGAAGRAAAGRRTGARAVLRTAQPDGAQTYFRALADASAAPLILYDIPYRTGAQLDTATLLALAEHRTSPPSRIAAAR